MRITEYNPAVHSKAHGKRLARALAVAAASDMRQKHGAILISGGRVLSVGVNTSRNDARLHIPHDAISRHAEVACLSGLNVANRVGKLYVARISSGGNVALSKPCPACIHYLEMWTHITEVIHT